MSEIKLSVVVPLYNEELVVSESYKRLSAVLNGMNIKYELVLVNDGSRDKTADMVREICAADKNVKLIDFSRNFGHQLAITAGMDYARGEAIVVIDGDLQDPPEVIPQMFEKWKEGFDVVYGKRTERKGDTFFKKFTAKVFYRFLKSMTDVEIPVDTGDFRLIDRKVADALKKVNEKNRYVRGLISWLGFKQTAVEFSRDKRFAGETKYPLKKMIKLATDGIMSFSFKPLKLASYAGIFISVVSVLFLVFLLVLNIFFKNITPLVPGWSSLIAVSLFFNGIILVILGIIGEYIGRIYDEAKGRPLYIVRDAIGYSDDEEKPQMR